MTLNKTMIESSAHLKKMQDFGIFMKPFLSLIIPAYNEEDRLARSLDKIFEYFDKQEYSVEVIVVDDGSTDNTAEMADTYPRKVKLLCQPQNKGKGAAVRWGMLHAEGKVRLFSDADLSTPIFELEKILSHIANGTDVAIGSRAVDYSLIKEHQPFYREFMGKTFNKIVRFLVIGGIKDTQCGFKAFTADAALKIFPYAKIDGFGFDVEILFLAKKAGLAIEEIPVEWYNDERSTVNPVCDSLKMLGEIIKIRRLHK